MLELGEESTSKYTHWREELKKDTKKYQDYLKFDALRARLIRQELMEDLHKPGNEELLKVHRAEKARKMREYRAAAKLQKEEDEKKNGKKPKTHAEKDKDAARKAKDAARKRKERAAMPKKKKKEINAKRREKNRQERERLVELQLKEQERKEQEQEKLQQEILRLQEEVEKLKKATPSRSTEAKRQSLSRAKKSISKEPHVYAKTVVDLANKASPRKKKVLEDKGVFSTTDINNVFAEGLKERLHKLSKSRKKKDLELKQALAPAFVLAKKYRCQRRVCKALKISEKLLTNRAKNPYKRAVSDEAKALVQDFYLQNSVTIPDKKLISKKTNLPACFLT